MKKITCKICSQEFTGNRRWHGLSIHLRRTHDYNNKKEYYDEYLLNDNNERICNNKNCNNKTKFVDIVKGYSPYCSHECATSSEKWKESRRNTMKERYGVDHNFKIKNENGLRPCQETMLEKYGAKTAMNVDKFKNKYKRTMKEKYNVDHNFKIKNENGLRPCQETMLEKYGVKNAFEKDEIYQKAIETWQEKYNTDNPSKADEVIEKIFATKKEKYNDKNYNNREKAKETMKEKYGVDNIKKLEEYKEKASRRRTKKIINNDITFTNNYNSGYYKSKLTDNKEYYHSSWELKRMKYLDKQGIHWTKNHNIVIPYKDNNNQKHRYIPDFLIENKIIEEIKPKHFAQKQTNKLKKASIWCNNHNYKFKLITKKEDLDKEWK